MLVQSVRQRLDDYSFSTCGLLFFLLAVYRVREQQQKRLSRRLLLFHDVTTWCFSYFVRESYR